jgi:thiol-disulfide isomerase/thioredoxin
MPHRKTRKQTRKNKKQKLGGGKIIVGLIHAEWCGHCQTLMPKWAEMVSQIEKNKKYKIVQFEDSNPNKDSIISDINSKLNETSEKLSADGFPTIFKVEKGNLQYYKEGPRETEALKNWFMGGNESKDLFIQNGGKKKSAKKKCSNFFSLW